jgi:hypothetical protein
MKKVALSTLILFVIIFNITTISVAQEKLAQTGLQFLSVVSDAKTSGMANSITSIEMQSSALFFNPATMGFDTSYVNASFSLNKWIADISHQNYSVSINPGDGQWGIFGLSLQLVDYGDILGTVVADNELGYEDIGNISTSSFALGFGYAKMLSDRFSIGGQVKWVRQSLGESIIPATDSTTQTAENEVSLLAFDFGTLFKTGFKSLAFGMSVRNFSAKAKYAQAGLHLPLTFSLGVSMDVLDFTDINKDNHSLMVSIDAHDARSHAAQMAFGLNYSFLNRFSVRSGYITNGDENDFSFGIGVSVVGFTFDYSLTPFGVFGNIQRISARFSI